MDNADLHGLFDPQLLSRGRVYVFGDVAGDFVQIGLILF